MNAKSLIFFKSIKDYLTNYLNNQRGASPNTIKSYKETLNQFFRYLKETYCIAFEDLTFDLLTKDNVTNYLQWIEEECHNSVSTRNQRLACIKSFATHASSFDLLLKAKLLELKTISVKKDLREKITLKYFDDEVLQAMLSQPNIKSHKGLRDIFFMSLLYDSGARVQELLDLKLNAINHVDSQPTVTLTGKGNKTRLVPLMPNTIKLFHEYVKFFHEPPTLGITLFYLKSKDNIVQLSQDCVEKFIEKYRISAKKNCTKVPAKITSHMFRHSRAMSLYRGGMPLSLLSEWLGHSNLATTTIYAKSDTKMKQEAIEKATSVLNPLRNKLPIEIISPEADDEKIIKALFGLS